MVEAYVGEAKANCFREILREDGVDANIKLWLTHTKLLLGLNLAGYTNHVALTTSLVLLLLSRLILMHNANRC